MGNFVAHYVVDHEPCAIHDLGAVPECIGAQKVTVVHRRHQGPSGIVQTIAAVFGKEEIVGVAGVAVRGPSVAVSGHAIRVALIADERAREVIGVVRVIGLAVLHTLDQVDVHGNAAGVGVDEQKLADTVRLLSIRYFDAPDGARLAIPGLQQLGVEDPELRHVGLQSPLWHLVPLCNGCERLPLCLTGIDGRLDIEVYVSADLSAHGDDTPVFVQVDLQLAGEDRNALMKLSKAVDRPAERGNLLVYRLHLEPRAGEPEQRPEMFDGRHRCDFRAGYLVDRRHHQWRQPRCTEVTHCAGSLVSFYSNVLPFEIVDQFADICWGFSASAQDHKACHQSHEQSSHFVTRPSGLIVAPILPV